MRDKVLVIFLLIGLMSCSDESVPAGIYDYQVERLLSGESGIKTWSLQNNAANCTDSVKLLFELVTNTTNDSLDISIINGCSPATATLIGRASASSPSDRIIFTDSLVFASGSYWIVNQITSDQLSLMIDDDQSTYVIE